MSIDLAYISDSLRKATNQEAADIRKSATEAFPFLEYAVQNVLPHSDAAQRDRVDQTHFIQSFELTKWIGINNVFETRGVRRYGPSTRLLYILGEKNLSNLIRVHPSNLSCFEAGKERYGCQYSPHGPPAAMKLSKHF